MEKEKGEVEVAGISKGAEEPREAGVSREARVSKEVMECHEGMFNLRIDNKNFVYPAGEEAKTLKAEAEELEKVSGNLVI